MATPKPPKKTKPKLFSSFLSFWKKVASYPLKLFRKVGESGWHIVAGGLLAGLVVTFLRNDFSVKSVAHHFFETLILMTVVISLILVYLLIKQGVSRYHKTKQFLTSFFAFIALMQSSKFFFRFFTLETYNDKIINLVVFFVWVLISILILRKHVVPLLKRIYRNSEGHIIPLLGGVFALSVFYSINALTHIYVHSIDGDGSSENKVIIFLPLGVFIGILIFVWIVMYWIKKANLKDDVTKELAEIFIKHFSPYEFSGDDKNTKEKNFHARIWLDGNRRIKKLIDEYIVHNKLNFTFSSDEISDEIDKKMRKNIISSIDSKLQTIPKEFLEKITDMDLDYIASINKNYNANILIIIKEGTSDNPKNSDLFEINIEQKDLPFVVFAQKGNKKFFDINTRYITHAEYKANEVTLTIAQPNAKPKKITISLSEWMANRNNLH